MEKRIGRLAQLVRASVLHTEGRRFDPVIAHHNKGERPMNMLNKDDRIQHMNVDAIASKYDSNGEWFEIIINDGRNRVAVISGPPGTPPDPHIHADYNEWWINVGEKHNGK